MSNRLPVAYSIALAILLALLAGPAAALGLGQIQVKSQPGQPLLAEIPVISSDPAELDQLQARLASPETFRRIGLEPPTGATSNLQFAVALDARGNTVIRVTSPAPVQQALLTFLVEVDWGEGRLVREYSALVDAPRTVAAPSLPPIQAPAVAPSNTIVRPVQAPVVVAPTPPAAPPTPAPAPRPVTAIPPSAPVAVAPAAAPAPAAIAPTPATEYGPVRPGQTLSQIAGQLDTAPGYSLDQTMLALLRANPDAFIGDDINKLKRGAVLRVPQAAELSQYSASQAAAVVREQIANWRASRRPVTQPAAIATAAATTPSAPVARQASAASKPAPQMADARLEIVPPSSSTGRRAGTRSGIDAGGEGDMLRQQLQETKETLAARDAEVQELKTRVADLEKLQQQQQQLLTMKDSELTAAQQNLAKSNRQAATAPVAAQAQQPAPANPQPVDRGGSAFWLWGGLALVVVALGAWWWSRRRRTAPVVVRTFDTAALAASIPSIAAVDRDDVDVDVDPAMAGDDDVYQEPDAIADEEIVAPAVPAAASPAWVGAASSAAPTWHGGAAATQVPVAADAINANQQLELARAYLDMGDDSAARELLREVLDGRDPAARTEAARLLRDL